MFLKPQTVSELLFKSLRYHANINMLHLTSNMLNAKKPLCSKTAHTTLPPEKNVFFLEKYAVLLQV